MPRRSAKSKNDLRKSRKKRRKFSALGGIIRKRPKASATGKVAREDGKSLRKKWSTDALADRVRVGQADSRRTVGSDESG
jgi:hypothetical protein